MLLITTKICTSIGLSWGGDSTVGLSWGGDSSVGLSWGGDSSVGYPGGEILQLIHFH